MVVGRQRAESLRDAAQFELHVSILFRRVGAPGTGAERRGGRPKPTSPVRSWDLLREIGRDGDLAVDDLLLDLVDLGHQRGVDLALEVVQLGERDTLVLEGADVRLRVELALGAGQDGVRGGEVHRLQDRGQHVVRRRRVGLEQVRVDADEGHVLVGLLDRLQSRLVDRAADGHDHVDALVEDVRGDRLRLLVGLEAAREGTGLAVPADDRDALAVLLVVVVDALLEAVHEDRHGRELHAAERADLAGLRVSGGEVAGEERGLGRVVEQRLDVVRVGLAVVVVVGGVVDEDEVGVGAGLRRIDSGGGEGEADRDDGRASLRDEALHVRGVVGLGVGLDLGQLHAEGLGGRGRPLEGELVERLVVEPAHVRDDARHEVGGRGLTGAGGL
ncbi:hypothetical protein ABE10_12315, partial [Bacillus toyonensis]|nr:hypothetical protein [Bacillus toyonensis]